ncbi:7-carboxy-7-deazaguanine synthase QueE [Reichenbachiella sp. MALMAid0571]|uniref:7-carboxy-7-deazaguanine synthase QueE n=1 Tax=Reichenbachiella sp. MALMAid0571 TaxID=3143939 RepID=UPI0032DF4F1A
MDQTLAITQKLPVMEIFYSIQGEGFHSGKPAVFVRLGGCDVGCHWCDVKESWNEKDHPHLGIEEIINEVTRYPSKTIIVTGGEPLMYNLDGLTSELKKHSYQLHLETSGVYTMTGQWDWITFSPKKFKKPDQSIYAVASELKAIVFNQSDFAFAESFVSSLNNDCIQYLQPEWSKSEQMTATIVEYIKAHPEWNISLQTHKYLNIP